MPSKQHSPIVPHPIGSTAKDLWNQTKHTSDQQQEKKDSKEN